MEGNERQLTHLTHLILDAALDGCFGARADENPIVCLGSDSRYWGLKTFDVKLSY
jgi:hypothetical protein